MKPDPPLALTRLNSMKLEDWKNCTTRFDASTCYFRHERLTRSNQNSSGEKKDLFGLGMYKIEFSFPPTPPWEVEGGGI